MLYLEKNTDSFVYTFPQSYYNREVLEYCIRHHKIPGVNFSLTDKEESSTIRIEGGISDSSIRKFFGLLNCSPVFSPEDAADFKNSSTPFISCVILLTANDIFVKNYLIPSIIENSKNFPVEIIIAYNGTGADLKAFENLKIVHSEFGCVPKAYNAGVSEARGEYIAIFHDDCIINDPEWIEKAVTILEDESISAVTAEIQNLPELGIMNARGVPLVMRRSEYFNAGGHDEYYYGGIEDIDFTYQVLSQGKRIEKLYIDYRHCNGMSTIIMLSRTPLLFKTLFGYNMIPKKSLNDFRSEYLSGPEFKELFSSVTAGNLLYFTDKFKEYFFSLNGADNLLKYNQFWQHASAGRSREELREEIITTYKNLISDKTFSREPGTEDIILELDLLQS